MSNQNKYVEIDLMKYIPLNSYVTLNLEFKRKLFTKAKSQLGSFSAIAKYLNKAPSTICGWIKDRSKPSLKDIINLSNLVGLKKQELANNIRALTSRYSNGNVAVKGWKLVFNDELSELLGLIKGDGSINELYVRCSNSFIDIPLFFANCCKKYFNLKNSQIKFYLDIPKGRVVDSFKIINKLKKLGYTHIKSYLKVKHKIRNEDVQRNEIIVTCSIEIKVLAQVFKNIAKNLYKLITKSPVSVKRAFIKGFSAAEGGVHRSGTQKCISITQKNTNILIFIKDLLNKLGFNHVSGPSPTSTAFDVRISSRFELEKFSREIGFGRHELKNIELKKVLNSFQTNIYRKSRNERLDEVLQLLAERGKACAKEIAKELDLSDKHIYRILNTLVLSNMVVVNKDIKPQEYFLRS